MKKNILKQLLVLTVFAAVLATLSSCNKGYGCPTNFKAVKTAVQVLQ